MLIRQELRETTPTENLGKETGNHPSTISHATMSRSQNRKHDNDVNGSSLTSGTASGRGAYRDSQVVIMRNPYRGVLKIGTWNVRSMTQPEAIESIKREMKRKKNQQQEQEQEKKQKSQYMLSVPNSSVILQWKAEVL